MSLAPGTRLGPYAIASAIGAGGQGEVYRARDTRLDRVVAVKVLPAHVATDPALKQRFEREAKAISSLSHPHICTLHDVGSQDGIDFLVMEYLEGETLAQRLAKGALPLTNALQVAVQIADALDKAHRQRIVHRDLKPGNIMLTKSGAKLLDFGLAKLRPVGVVGTEAVSAAPTMSAPLTGAGSILGTVQYMAPEQLDGQEADSRTDIFAFGSVLYEMLTGRRAFEGKSQASVIGAILHATPAPLSTVQPITPPTLDRLVATCLAKDPDERWQSAGDVMRELKWIAAGGAQTADVGLVATRPQPAAATVRFTVSAPRGGVRRIDWDFALAPDGRTLAFRATGSDGVSRILLRHLDETEAQPLAGTEDAGAPFWAPDGRSLGFAKSEGLYRVALDGSAPRRLCDVPGAVFDGGTWSSRGVIVFARPHGGLLRVPDTGGVPTPVTPLDAETKEGRHRFPWFLPDGRHVLFQAAGGIWVTSIDDPARTRIVEGDGPAVYADGWLLSTTGRPRSLIAQPFDPERLALSGTPQPVCDRLSNSNSPQFSVSSNGVLVVDRPPPLSQQLVWVDRTGRAVGSLGPKATIDAFALAPDERRVVASVVDRESLRMDLWLFESGREEGTRLTYEGRPRRPYWALDGRRIYFTQRGTSRWDLYTLAIGAMAPAEFETPASFRCVCDVTRDGQYIVFMSEIPSSREIWIQHAGDPHARRPLVQGAGLEAGQARVSPDGKWLAYSWFRRLFPEREIFVQPFDRPGDRIQVSVKGGRGPVWRDDSRELYYEGPEGLMAVPMSEHDGTLEAGTPQKLFSLRTQPHDFTEPHNVEVAANGETFLVNMVVDDSDNVPLEVTLNWTTGLMP